jgi:hypothetical protein
VGVLDGNQNSSIVIRQWGYVELQPKFFYCHLIHPRCSMVTKNEFGHPKRHGVKGMKW